MSWEQDARRRYEERRAQLPERTYASESYTTETVPRTTPPVYAPELGGSGFEGSR